MLIWVAALFVFVYVSRFYDVRPAATLGPRPHLVPRVAAVL